MVFLTPETMNATRQSIRNCDWIQGMRVSTGPLRSSFRRMGRNLIRGRARTDSQYIDPEPAPAFSDTIYPLYVAEAKDLQVAELDRLFSDVERQIRGEFRLAGSGYHKVEFGPTDQFSEIEDQHALERLYWAARYARGAAFGHTNAYKALRMSWTKWLNSAHGTATFAAYTVAERISSLSECLFWLRHCSDLDAAEIISMKRQIWKDANRLSANIEYGLGIHNHLLNDARGLFRASRVLPDIPEASTWRELSFDIWDKHFPKLVLEDGSFAEQSSHYQLLVCRTALEYFLAARLSHRTLPAGLETRLSQMQQVANDLLRPDGSLPRFGDSSPDHTVEDLWGLMSAAYHSGLLQTRPRHDTITPLTLLYCGEAPRLPRRPAVAQASFYPQGGFMFLRSADRATELTVHADPSSETRAHGSCGRGSFELWWQGYVIVREPGSILSSSSPRSAWSRSGLAQNVTCLNGLPPGVRPEDRKFLPMSYANQGGAWVECREREMTFRWNGFNRIRQDIILWRTWAFDNEGDLSLEERIEGTGEVKFQSRLCLGDGRWKLYAKHSQGIAQLRWVGPDSRSVLVDLDVPLGVTPTLTAGWYLPEFGIEKQAPLLLLEGNVKLPLRWTTRWKFCAASREVSSELSQQCAG